MSLRPRIKPKKFFTATMFNYQRVTANNKKLVLQKNCKFIGKKQYL